MVYDGEKVEYESALDSLNKLKNAKKVKEQQVKDAEAKVKRHEGSYNNCERETSQVLLFQKNQSFSMKMMKTSFFRFYTIPT